jgi:putative toxin-antitoxin system antitoxin component (TIGR02293 family)
MKKKGINIVSVISKKTGFTEEETSKIITEFARTVREASSQERITIVPGVGYITVVSTEPPEKAGTVKTSGIPDAQKWYIADNQIYVVQEAQPESTKSFHPADYSSQHIINELKSDKKSNEILESFMKISEMPNKVLAEQVFEISPKTLHSYRNSIKDLPVRIYEHILKLEGLYKKGVEIFESSEHFNIWLKSESYGLGNVKPIKLINSITGIDLVYEELVRIEYGATA